VPGVAAAPGLVGQTPFVRRRAPAAGQYLVVDNVALVTGASAGIGRAIADHLAARGWEVVGASRRGTGGARWDGLVMDVDDDDSVADGVAGTVARHGRLDAVVTCAGFGVAGPSEATPMADARSQLETNFWGTVRVVHAALPSMREQHHGRVVLVGSIGGVVALPFQSFYSASKFALEGWGEALAWEVAPFGVDVTLVQPGNVRTDFTDSRRTVGLADADGDGDGHGDGDGDGVRDGGSAGAAYRDAATRAIDTMVADERDGVAPDVVARAVAKVLAARRPPRRVSVGRPSERVGVMAKRLLPGRVFEAAARGSLGV